ncbi:MAG: FAD-binding protein [Sulfolobales archaeon]
MGLYKTDVLVIGCGGAGCRAAIEAKKSGVDVILLCKGKLGIDGCTPNSASEWMAYSVALGLGDPNDGPEEHFKDIVVTGAYVLNQELARIIAYEAIDRFYDLVKYGVPFLKTPDGKFLQLMSDGATYPRACGTGADTGKRIMEVLAGIVRDLGIEVRENFMAVDLIVDHGRCYGVYGLDINKLDPEIYIAKSVVLAAGGLGDIFMHSVYPSGMSGDGYAMALRAGAKVVNMEFMQIGPCITSKFKFDVGGPLWRLGPKLYNNNGEEFLKRYLPTGVGVEDVYRWKSVTFPFTVRNPSGLIDVACFTEIFEGRGTPDGFIYFDLTHVGNEVVEKVPYTYKFLLSHGLDLRKEPIKIAPAVQHLNGGVLINEKAETDIKGLYAAGEVAGGQHGADRPGGNSLVDCQVFGTRAGKYAAEFAKNSSIGDGWRNASERIISNINIIAESSGSYEPTTVKDEIKKVLWYNATVIRDGESLSEAIGDIIRYRDEVLPNLRVDGKNLVTALELRNIIDVAIAMLTSMLVRKESRGGHYRVDFPFRDDVRWVKMITIRKLHNDYVTEFIEPTFINLVPTAKVLPIFIK